MLLAVFIIGFIVFLVFCYLTDPFNRYSLIKLPFRFKLSRDTKEVINRNHKLTVRQGFFFRMLAMGKAGVHILHTRYISSPRSKGETVEKIIEDIHRRRFDPDKLLVISGDHFNGLFVRNLGVFYYPLLDTSGPLPKSGDDWDNRQSSYLQTVAYALGVYAKSGVPTTTIVPTGPLAATCVNFYAYPSDTVYGIFFALAALSGKQSANPYVPSSAQKLPLQTKPAAKMLISSYGETLSQLYAHYRDVAFDDATGLINASVHLSGAKDITRRTCAFYDNVIFWKTTKLAQVLGVIPPEDDFLEALKKRILKTFWLDSEGYFLEDLSPVGVRDKYYSSDWLAVLFTEFLDPEDPRERSYFERSIAYIQKNGIDKPFAIKYQNETRAGRQFLPVRLAVASYGGDSIWSFWGMEYIKALLMLYKATGNKEHLSAAEYHIKIYEQKMLEYGGFPELYDAHGTMMQTPLYRSIRQTGWVVGFEQARALRDKVTSLN